jgi:hypothetical protein
MLMTLLVAGLFTACTTASIQDTWRSPEAPATVYRKLLVVGVANDVNMRRLFENIFVEKVVSPHVAVLRTEGEA